MAAKASASTKKTTRKAPAKKTTKRKVGRPKKEITDLHLRVIEDKAQNSTLDEIATLLDIAPATLDRWLTLPEVRAAYDKGRAIAKETMANNLFQQAMGGSVPATIFWLKAQAGWSDKPQAEETSNSQVVFYLPDNGRPAT